MHGPRWGTVLFLALAWGGPADAEPVPPVVRPVAPRRALAAVVVAGAAE